MSQRIEGNAVGVVVGVEDYVRMQAGWLTIVEDESDSLGLMPETVVDPATPGPKPLPEDAGVDR